MKKVSALTRLFFFFLVFAGMSQAQSGLPITFSEIMFNPTSGNNEFIELYNTSLTDSIDLANFKIKYYTSNPDGLFSTGAGTKLSPRGFAVIFEGDYDLASGIYKNLLPSSALILKISDNSFGTSGMANTTDRELKLISSAGDTLDTYLYSANNGTGISDEKKILSKDNSSTNWGNALHVNGTPGFRNSVSPLTIDVGVSSITVTPIFPIVGSTVEVEGVLKNYGISSVQNFTAEVFLDTNKNSLGETEEKVFEQKLSLNPNDSTTILCQLQNLVVGNYQIIVSITLEADENQANNSKLAAFTVLGKPNSFNDLVINEIMYAPTTGEPEWVELFNRSEKPINLKKWKISDNATPVAISNIDVFIPAKSYIVLSKDSTVLNYYNITSQVITLSLPALNNTDDAVVLRDSLNILMDSVYYFSSWGGGSGRSLERIDMDQPAINQSNWKTSTGIYKATPGKINSVTRKDFDGTVTDISFSPKNPIAGDNISFSAKAKNPGKNELSFQLELYLDENLDSIPDAGAITSDSFTLIPLDSLSVPFNYVYNNFKGTKGFFVKGIFAQDDDTTNNSFYKTLSAGFPSGSVLINEVMFTPVNGEPEWVEVFNASTDTINLKDWTINDVYTTPAYGKVSGDFILLPQAFGVLAKDSSIINYHRTIPSNIAKLTLPVLNNDADGVVLKDNRAIMMDSVLYYSGWGGTNGFSLERKLLSVPANYQDNWGSSLDIEQSTPGRINSQTPKEYDLTISKLATDQSAFGENESFLVYAMVKNIGRNVIQQFSVKFFIDTDSNRAVDNLFDTQSISAQLQSGDSIKIFSGVNSSISKKTLFASKIIFADDADSLNNYAEKYFEPGYRSQSIVINEVMYNPNDNEPEWIELKANDSLNLKNWSITDSLSTPTKVKITYNDFYLSPNEFVVFAKDSISFFNAYHSSANTRFIPVYLPSLSNTEDGIHVYDFRDALIDRMHYKSTWAGKKGFSIEHVIGTSDSLSWITSLALKGNSAGEENFLPNQNLKRNAIVINEIMFAPDVDNSEFIEFQNISNDSINIGGWRFEDEKGNFYKLSETGFVIPPGEFFLFAADSVVLQKYPELSSFLNISIATEPSLGFTNTGELIQLKNIFGAAIDSVVYSDSWHNKNILNTKNKSLERINPDLDGNLSANWSTSVAVVGATPGRLNSIYTKNTNRGSNISVSPNPFSPDNDGVEDFTIINYNLSQAISQTRIKIFDAKGRLVRTLINNQASGQSGSIIFDGLDDSGNPLRIGMYIVYLEAMSDASAVVDKLKTVVVVARKL
ncbi:MAG: lamin tail domain-containing protein [Ignavibacteriaceae bacterium]|jgi:hypothetical protein